MKLRVRAVAGWAVGTCLVSWVFSACLSPTLPLPPPGEPSVAELSADRKTVRLVGQAIAGASVYAVDLDTPDVPGQLVFADPHGTYVFKNLPIDLSVSSTNVIDIWQSYGSEISGAVRLRVPKDVAFGAAPVDDADGATTTSEAGLVDAGASDAA